MQITVDTVVAAPLAEVWRAYSAPEDIMQWNAASDDWHTPSSTVDFRVGGSFTSRMEARDGSMGFDFEGTYTTIVEHELIEYRFGDRMARITFTPTADGVQVRVTFDAESTHPPEQQQQGWQAILDNFRRHVEAGEGGRDLRADLRLLVLAQYEHFAAHQAYATDLDALMAAGSYRPMEGHTAEVTGDATGFTATVRRVDAGERPDRATIWVGDHAARAGREAAVIYGE